MILAVLPFVFCFIQMCASLPTTEKTPKAKYSDWDSLFESNATSVVQLLHHGNKSYFFGFHFKATYFQAAQFCDDIHMKLVAIENAEENNRLYKYVRDANKGDLFWTSGSKLLDGKHWIWTSQGIPVEFTNWAPGNPDSQVEHCLAAYHSKNIALTWTDRDCLVQMSFICEKRKQHSEEIRMITDILDWKSVYENPYMSANVPLFHTKDKSYFLGRYFKATFQEAVQLCQIMKMNLVAITSEEENNRIYKYIRDTNAGDSFWTSGTRMIDGTTWVWMSTAHLMEYTNWYTGQPDSVTDNCIQLLAQKDKGLFWVDSNCLSRFFYICEKPRDIVLFDRRASLAKQHIESVRLTDLPLIRMDKRMYYLGNNVKITQLEASNFCQRNNMQLISINSEEDNEEIRQLLLHHSAPTGRFWTSARRSSSSDKWTWATGSPMIYSKLEYTKGDALCIGIFHNATWSDQRCDQEQHFICEKVYKMEESPRVAPIVDVYVDKDALSKNISMPCALVKIANATFDIGPEIT